ncbi:MAG TPA: type IV toxin-antitoxin system AbiEi family antitoxin domain-containing protein [Nocardioidaceae bacterium]|nr:type IV toxin-antitoxin system AbiEi family antitoxin domain-containing protein [Nocardioidaceae bacterium]
MSRNDPPLGPVFTRRDARRAGFTKHQLDNRVATGAWRSLARGAYCLEETWEESNYEARQILTVTAALAIVSYPAWASHASAAALLDLPFPSRSPAWITRMPPASTRYSDQLTVEVATVPLRDQWTVRGLPTLSFPRTVADGMRHFPPPDGLALIDAALRRKAHVLSEVGRVLEYSSDWPYAARAALVLPHANGVRESPLESWSYWHMASAGLPLPWCQVDLYDVHGNFLGRTDFWWDQFGAAGEADGRTKYDVLAGGTVEDAKRAVIEEKQREDVFRRSGARVARWGSSDLGRTRSWSRWLERFLHAEPRRFQGHAVRRDGAA